MVMMDNHCGYTDCELEERHRHCGYCKETMKAELFSRRNCDLCSREITAKTKLGRVRTAIKKQMAKCEEKEKDKIIAYLKSKTQDISKASKSFYGSDEDIARIIDNYFDKSIPLPLILIDGCGGRVDLNNSRKKRS